MLYHTCPECGANLDPEESCDCQDSEEGKEDQEMPNSHCDNCLATHPSCPCNSCRHDLNSALCCSDIHARRCSDIEPCPFYDADEKEPDQCNDSDSKN